LRILFLKLDRAPPDNDWLRLFFEERESRIVARRRGLWIEDDTISFDALPAEVEIVHMPDIRRSVDYANREYRKLYTKKRNAREHEQRSLAAERDELVALRDRLRASFAAPEPEIGTAFAEPPATEFHLDVLPAQPAPVPAPAPAAEKDPLIADFDARRESLKQRFRHAAHHLDKEQKRGND
jgi:hypothetical protein